MKKILLTIVVCFLFVNGVVTLAHDLSSIQNKSIDATKQLVFPVSFNDARTFQIINTNDGQKIVIEGYTYLLDPGKPMLPSKQVVIALPPGATIQTIDIKVYDLTKLSGIFSIMPTPPIVPMDHHVITDQKYLETMEKQRDTEKKIYTTDTAYPNQIGQLIGVGGLRKYMYASFLLCPFTYHPRSGHLYRYDSAEVTITYDLPSDNSKRALDIEKMKWDTLADTQASSLFMNYNQIKELYKPAPSHQNPLTELYDYVIITTDELEDLLASSNFVAWKNTLGYNVRIVSISDDEITSQPGQDLAEQIRNFLREYYIDWGIQFVLFVGDYETVPMRYCYPDPNNHQNTAGTPGGPGGEVPTDYYYADLSSADEDSWDYDGDGYHGEFNQDLPDFFPEVYVGRIPINDPSRILYTLDKTEAFESDTSNWKTNALHAGAFFYFTNEENSGYPAMDGATCCYYIENDFMNDWTISHYSEQDGLEPSVYEWDALSETAFTTDWRTGQYSIVNWGAHGWTDKIGRKIWSWDDGDGVPESHEMSWPNLLTTLSNLDDDYPSIVTAISCLVGYPEPNAWGNMGIDLLTKPSYGASIGVIASARSPYGSVDWPNNPGGSDSIIYEFNNNLINKSEKVGEALYKSKYFCNLHYGWNVYPEYIDMYTFNLFGDPSLILKGTSGNIPEVEIIKPESALYLANIKLLPFFTPIIIGKVDIEVEASANEGVIDYVEIFIENELQATLDSEPYSWRWNERAFGRKTILVKAHNQEGLYGRDEIEVWKFF